MGSLLGSGLRGRRRRRSMGSHSVKDGQQHIARERIRLEVRSVNQWPVRVRGQVSRIVSRTGGIEDRSSLGSTYRSHDSRLPVKLRAK